MTKSDGEPTKRPMTLAEAGRKGGEKVKRERGLDFYAEIGRKGGRRVAQDHGPAFYSEIGRKGGEARRSEHDETPPIGRPYSPPRDVDHEEDDDRP